MLRLLYITFVLFSLICKTYIHGNIFYSDYHVDWRYVEKIICNDDFVFLFVYSALTSYFLDVCRCSSSHKIFYIQRCYIWSSPSGSMTPRHLVLRIEYRASRCYGAWEMLHFSLSPMKRLKKTELAISVWLGINCFSRILTGNA